jgi:hypothetical protein
MRILNKNPTAVLRCEGTGVGLEPAPRGLSVCAGRMASCGDGTVTSAASASTLEASWEERWPRNVQGVARALTVLSPIAPFWVRWLKLYFGLRRLVPWLGTLAARPLRRLSFIHFARWTLVERLPGPEGAAPPGLESTYLYFESNFNGGFGDYIDAFAYVIPWRMRLIWHGSYGFPGPRPAEPFKAYIEDHCYEAGYYYSAYPRDTVTMIEAALRVANALERLSEDSARDEPERFQERYRDFLAEVQLWL